MKPMTFLMIALFALGIAETLFAQTGPALKDSLKLAAMEEQGYEPLFSADLSNAVMEADGWTCSGAEIVANGKGDLWTKARYGDFMLDLEFLCEADTNSGVFVRCPDIADWFNTTLEVQVLQPNENYENKTWHCGGIFDCLAPRRQVVKPAGEWNRMRIVAAGLQLHVWLNGEWVAAMDLSQWNQAGKNPDGTSNRYKVPCAALSRQGHIGLQYHGQAVRYRNVRIKGLPG